MKSIQNRRTSQHAGEIQLSLIRRFACHVALITSDLLVLPENGGRILDAAAILVRAGERQPSLIGACMIEMASFHLRRGGALRKAVFHLMMAGNRYHEAIVSLEEEDGLVGLLEEGRRCFSIHSVRCYAMALSILRSSECEEKGLKVHWESMEDHLYFTLARQMVVLRRFKAAFVFFLHLVGYAKHSASYQREALRDFLYLCSIQRGLLGGNHNLWRSLSPSDLLMLDEREEEKKDNDNDEEDTKDGGSDQEENKEFEDVIHSRIWFSEVEEVTLPEVLDDFVTIISPPSTFPSLLAVDDPVWEQLEMETERSILNRARIINGENEVWPEGRAKVDEEASSEYAFQDNVFPEILSPTFLGKKGILDPPEPHPLLEPILVKVQLKNKLSVPVDISHLHLILSIKPKNDLEIPPNIKNRIRSPIQTANPTHYQNSRQSGGVRNSSPSESGLSSYKIDSTFCRLSPKGVPSSQFLESFRRLSCSSTESITPESFPSLSSLANSSNGHLSMSGKRISSPGKGGGGSITSLSNSSLSDDDDVIHHEPSPDYSGFNLFHVDAVSFFLQPNEIKEIVLRIIPREEGDIHIEGLRWRVFGQVWLRHAFERYGPLLQSSVVQRVEKRRGRDRSLKRTIVSPLPNLMCMLRNIPDNALQGEVMTCELFLQNEGNAPVDSCYVSFSHPTAFLPLSPGTTIDEPSLQLSPFSDPLLSSFLIPLSTPLQPGGRLSIPVLFRPTFSGDRVFSLVIRYSCPSSPVVRYCREVVSCDISPSLSFSSLPLGLGTCGVRISSSSMPILMSSMISLSRRQVSCSLDLKGLDSTLPINPQESHTYLLNEGSELKSDEEDQQDSHQMIKSGDLFSSIFIPKFPCLPTQQSRNLLNICEAFVTSDLIRFVMSEALEACKLHQLEEERKKESKPMTIAGIRRQRERERALGNSGSIDETDSTSNLSYSLKLLLKLEDSHDISLTPQYLSTPLFITSSLTPYSSLVLFWQSIVSSSSQSSNLSSESRLGGFSLIPNIPFGVYPGTSSSDSEVAGNIFCTISAPTSLCIHASSSVACPITLHLTFIPLNLSIQPHAAVVDIEGTPSNTRDTLQLVFKEKTKQTEIRLLPHIPTQVTFTTCIIHKASGGRLDRSQGEESGFGIIDLSQFILKLSRVEFDRQMKEQPIISCHMPQSYPCTLHYLPFNPEFIDPIMGELVDIDLADQEGGDEEDGMGMEDPHHQSSEDDDDSSRSSYHSRASDLSERMSMKGRKRQESFTELQIMMIEDENDFESGEDQVVVEEQEEEEENFEPESVTSFPSEGLTRIGEEEEVEEELVDEEDIDVTPKIDDKFETQEIEEKEEKITQEESPPDDDSIETSDSEDEVEEEKFDDQSENMKDVGGEVEIDDQKDGGEVEIDDLNDQKDGEEVEIDDLNEQKDGGEDMKDDQQKEEESS